MLELGFTDGLVLISLVVAIWSMKIAREAKEINKERLRVTILKEERERNDKILEKLQPYEEIHSFRDISTIFFYFIVYSIKPYKGIHRF